MRFHLIATSVLVGCAHAGAGATMAKPDGPALVLDGTVLSCRVDKIVVPDTGCAALAFLTVKEVSFLAGVEAVRYFGPIAQNGAYVAQSPALDLTPLAPDGRAVPLTVIVDGARFVCLQTTGGDRIMVPSRGPVFPCLALEDVAPDEIADVEVMKPPRSIVLFGRNAAAGALIVTLQR